MSINGVITLPPVAPSALPPFGVNEIRKRTHAIQEVMRGVMKEGTHFGTIPGTPKPSLWKAGAEVLCMTFRLAPLLESRVTVDDPEAEWSYTAPRRDGSLVTGTCIGFFEVEASCTIQGAGGETLSRCGARCNNREAKYRGLTLYDLRNTIQKMAEKRAFVSAVLMATGASDIFTQDVEDFPELVEGAPPQSERCPKEAKPPSPQPEKQPTKGSSLSLKREAWLRRVAEEGKVGEEVVQRCMAYLNRLDGQAVGAFFDDLARRKGEAFRPFKSAS